VLQDDLVGLLFLRRQNNPATCDAHILLLGYASVTDYSFRKSTGLKTRVIFGGRTTRGRHFGAPEAVSLTKSSITRVSVWDGFRRVLEQERPTRQDAMFGALGAGVERLSLRSALATVTALLALIWLVVWWLVTVL
jgi:hypothetical protein